MAGRSLQIPRGRHDVGQSGHFGVTDRHAPHAWFGCKHRGNDVFALFGFQRAGAIDQCSAGLEQCDRLFQQPLLQGGQRRDIRFLLEPGHVRMTADGAGCGAGRIDQYAVEAVAGDIIVPVDGIGDERPRVQR